MKLFKVYFKMKCHKKFIEGNNSKIKSPIEIIKSNSILIKKYMIILIKIQKI